MRSIRASDLVLGLSVAFGCWGACASAYAAEGGGGVYLLGLRSGGAGVTPPPGVFFSNQLYIYSGSRLGVQPLVGGGIIVNAEGTAVIDIPTVVWVTQADVMGAKEIGRYANLDEIGSQTLIHRSIGDFDGDRVTVMGLHATGLSWSRRRSNHCAVYGLEI
ncbi:hypothetical protein [Mesorhizobium sp. 43Arga]